MPVRSRCLPSTGSRLAVAHRRHEQHVRAFLARTHVEILVGTVLQNRRRKRPKRLAELDLQVHHRLHLRAPRVADDAARSERARTELHATLKPADDLLPRDQVGHGLAERLVRVEFTIDGPDAVEERADLRVDRARAQQRPVLRVARTRHARLVEQLMPDEQRDAQRPPGIAGRRLNPDVLKRAFAQDAPVARRSSARRRRPGRDCASRSRRARAVRSAA